MRVIARSIVSASALAAGLLCAGFTHPGVATETLGRRLSVASYTIQPLELRRSDSGYTTRVRLADAEIDLALAPCSLRADSFRVLVDDGSGALTRVPPPDIVTYRGDAPALPGSSIRASITPHGLSGVLTLPDGTSWGIQPVSELTGAPPAPEHVVYPVAGVRAPQHQCLTEHADLNDQRPAPGFAPRGETDRIAEVAFDADFEYFQLNGSSVENVVRDIESLMNGVESIFEFNTGVTFEVTTIIVRAAEPDPYTTTDPLALLAEFRSHWESSYGPGNAIQRDLAHLCTGKNLAAGVVATANVGGVCTSNAYSHSRTRYTQNVALRRSLVAHQFGHNFGAGHCDGKPDCNIMCGCNGCGPAFGCSGDVTHFGPAEAAEIAALADAAPCLTPGPSAPLALLEDAFDSPGIDPNRWTYVDGAVVSPDAVAPPSPPFALRLSAENASEFSDAEIRSNEIDPEGSAVLRFAVQARGVPAGGELFVEVWSSDLRWVTVEHIVSDGVDDTVFTPFEITLDADLVHAHTRLRLRADVDAPDHNWFIDDIYLGPSGTSCRCDWNDDESLTSQDFFDFLADFFNESADFNDDGVTTSQDFFDFLACFFEGC